MEEAGKWECFTFLRGFTFTYISFSHEMGLMCYAVGITTFHDVPGDIVRQTSQEQVMGSMHVWTV